MNDAPTVAVRKGPQHSSPTDARRATYRAARETDRLRPLCDLPQRKRPGRKTESLSVDDPAGARQSQRTEDGQQARSTAWRSLRSRSSLTRLWITRPRPTRTGPKWMRKNSSLSSDVGRSG